jgi:hypothetical protein
MKNVTFLTFPKSRDLMERLQKWVKACGRKNFSVDKVKRHTRICSQHFVGGKGPTEQHPDPIPAWYGPDKVV